MIAFKCIQTFTPTKHGLFLKQRPARSKNFILLSKSNDSDTAEPPPEGDMKKQDLLFKIAMLQTEKVRLTEYLDERSEYLTQFAEEATAEIEQIGEEALKELDEASDRIMGNLESQMQAFEESAGLNKLEIEKNEEKLAEFEGQIDVSRNEGMFFKNLALISLLSVGIVDSLISASDYRKSLVLGVLLIGVISQVIKSKTSQFPLAPFIIGNE